MQENEQASTASGQDFGPSLPGSFAYFDRDTSSWKTSGLFLFEELTAYSGTWPKRGTMRSGSVFALPTSARPTDASGCSSWPTPVANDDNKSPEAHLAMKRRMKGGPRNTITSLTVMMKSLWPTPNKMDGERGAESRETKAARGSGGVNLIEAVTNWPTPTSSEADKMSGPRRDGDRTLNGEAKKWNTPRSRDWKGDGKDCLPNQAKQWQTPNASVADAGARSRSGDRKDELLLAGQALQGVPSTTGNRRESFVLNAAWVATLMGFPADWLDGIEPPSKP